MDCVLHPHCPPPLPQPRVQLRALELAVDCVSIDTGTPLPDSAAQVAMLGALTRLTHLALHGERRDVGHSPLLTLIALLPSD